jgi:hypothetical protein
MQCMTHAPTQRRRQKSPTYIYIIHSYHIIHVVAIAIVLSLSFLGDEYLSRVNEQATTRVGVGDGH